MIPVVDPRLIAAQRLAEITADWQANPGRAIHGTGTTGLASNDAHGYSDMLNEQQEYMRLKAEAAGTAAPNITEGAALPSTRTLTPATGLNNTPVVDNSVSASMNGIQRAQQEARLKAARDAYVAGGGVNG